MKFKWEDSLMLGIKKMDDEHKLLIEQANHLFDALGDTKKSDLAIIETINFLSKYVVDHFNSEEQLQRQYKYPGIKEHQAIHHQFKNEIAQLVEDIKTNGLTVSKKIAINKHLIHWLSEHIGVEDKKLAEHIKKQQSL